MVLPLVGQEAVATQLRYYAERYSGTPDAQKRIRLANDFFSYLQKIDYLDESVVFPNDAHIDSVDVNVYYYIAEWYYGDGQYSQATAYCSRAAEACSEKVDVNSKGDVYSLLGAAYFRLGEFDKAADALHVCYEIDSKGGDYDQLSSTLNNIASIFVAAGKPQEAEKYILEAIAANSLTQNMARRAVLFGTASEMYRGMGDEEQSLSYARRALEIERERGDSAKIGVRLSQVANAELGLSRIDDAQRSLEEAMPLLEAAGNKHSLGICMNQMGTSLLPRERTARRRNTTVKPPHYSSRKAICIMNRTRVKGCTRRSNIVLRTRRCCIWSVPNNCVTPSISSRQVRLSAGITLCTITTSCRKRRNAPRRNGMSF